VVTGHEKFDPYLGVALVYSHYSTSWSGPFAAPDGGSASTTGIAGQAGLRYFVSEKVAVQGQLGFGYGTLGVGATWKF
jgi:outer membrane protein W